MSNIASSDEPNSTNKELDYKDVEFISKGPKPRIYLYNEECMNIIKAKEDIKLKLKAIKSRT